MRPPEVTMSIDHRRDRSRDNAKPRDKDDVIRPPRPPCWQDFTRSGKSLSFSDLHLAKDSSSIPGSGSSCTSGTSRRQQRHHQPQRRKNRLHRTRSEVCISHCGLTEEDYTQNLAEMNPRQLGLQRRSDFDNRLYFDESMQRCQRWLAEVKASEPLQDFEGGESETEHTSVHMSSSEGSDIELEIPDECVSGFDRTLCDVRLGFPTDTIAEEVEGLDADDVTITCDDVTVITKDTSQPANPAFPFSRPLHHKRITARSKGHARSRSGAKDKERGQRQ